MMGRKISFAQLLGRLRFGTAALACVAAAWVVQDAAGSEIGRTVQKHGDKLELLLRGKRGNGGDGDKRSPTPPPRQRAPDEPIQPWERVTV